jgi:hypothetical protein
VLGLVDELHFMIGNVVLGDGTLIFIEPIAYNNQPALFHSRIRRCRIKVAAKFAWLVGKGARA